MTSQRDNLAFFSGLFLLLKLLVYNPRFFIWPKFEFSPKFALDIPGQSTKYLEILCRCRQRTILRTPSVWWRHGCCSIVTIRRRPLLSIQSAATPPVHFYTFTRPVGSSVHDIYLQSTSTLFCDKREAFVWLCLIFCACVSSIYYRSKRDCGCLLAS